MWVIVPVLRFSYPGHDGRLQDLLAGFTVLEIHEYRLNGFGYFWGMLAGIASALVLPQFFPGSGLGSLAAFPFILGLSALVGVVASLVTAPEDDETLYVLGGDLTFYLEDSDPISATVGSLVHIPGGTRHAFRVDSDLARVIDITTPQHEQFLRAAAVPAQARTVPPKAEPDLEKLEAAAREYKVEILGPPPGA